MASTGRIAAEIKSNQYVTEDYLERLEEEGKVTRIEVPNTVYWELTKSTSTLKKEGNKKWESCQHYIQ